MRFIILLGPKHSGKTSVGKALALLLSGNSQLHEFVDLDDYIEQRSGKSPRALYIEGQEIFRQAEAEAIEALFRPEMTPPFSSLVVASGGGLADNPDALALLAKHTAVIPVFLDVSAETAWERIAAAGTLPPFLNTEDPQNTHHSLHERRAAVYRQLASLVIKADGKSPQEIAQEILNSIQV